MQLIVVRHAETPWSISGQHTGRTDLDLTDAGRASAIALGPLLRSVIGSTSPLIYSSPLRRATETARLALDAPEVHIDQRLAEFDYGAFEGLTYAQISEERPGWSIWKDHCPGGESLDDVARRVDAFLAAHAGDQDQPVVVFSHGHLSRVLVCRALGLEADQGALFDIANASVSLIYERRGSHCIGLWNATTDLAGH